MDIEEFKAIVGDVGTGEQSQTQPPVPQQSDVPLVAETSAIEQPSVASPVDISSGDPFASIGFPAAPIEGTASDTASSPSTDDPFASVGFPIAGSQPAAEEEQTETETTNLEQATSGINEGIGNLLGLPGDLSAAATNLGSAGINALLGTELPTDVPALFGSEAINESVLDPFISDVDPQTAAQRYLRAGGRAVGQSVVPVGAAVGAAARPVRTSAQILASELGAEGGAQVARDVAPDSVAAEIVGSILGAFAPTSAVRTSQRVGNLIGRIVNSGDSRAIAGVRRVVGRMASNSPANVTERDIINAIASDESIQRYLSQNVPDSNVSAGVINAGAANSPNTLNTMGRTTIRGTVDPVTGEASPSLVRQEVDAAQEAVTRLGAMTENSLSNLTPSRLAEISKTITDEPGGRIFERLLVPKIAEFIDNDTAFLREAGYRAGETPVIWYDGSTGVPYLIKKENGQIPNDLSNVPPSGRISAFQAPTLKNASGNVLSSVRGEIDALALSDFREGRVADQQLAADVFSPASRLVSQTTGESSPEFAETSARQRAARVGQEALSGAARGEGTNALLTIRRQIEELDPDDPLLDILDSIDPQDAGLNLQDITQGVREADILTRVGGELNPNSTGTDYLDQVGAALGQAIALGGQSNISNMNAGRQFARFLRRKNIPGRPSKAELTDAEVIRYMLDLTSDREKFSRVFNALRDKSNDRELTNAVNNFVAFTQGAVAASPDNDLEAQLGAQ